MELNKRDTIKWAELIFPDSQRIAGDRGTAAISKLDTCMSQILFNMCIMCQCSDTLQLQTVRLVNSLDNPKMLGTAFSVVAQHIGNNVFNVMACFTAKLIKNRSVWIKGVP